MRPTHAQPPSSNLSRSIWWKRIGAGRGGFRLVDVHGLPVRDPEALRRFRGLAIPPAWKDVRVSPASHGRLQALGVDGDGRTQYVYHPSFVAKKQREKFDRLQRFGERLPHLRRALENHLEAADLTRERVLATIARLIVSLYFRVGSERGARRYHTYGVTTLRRHHVRVGKEGLLTFSFTGKHHIHTHRIIVDASVARTLRELKDAPGARLFKYVGDDGRFHILRDRDVNDYIKSTAGPEFTAKDLRTWAGTLLAARELATLGKPQDAKSTKGNITQAVRRVAEQLGNTAPVCRESYIHPAVLEQYAEGIILTDFSSRPDEESALKALLQGEGTNGALLPGCTPPVPRSPVSRLAQPELMDLLTVP